MESCLPELSNVHCECVVFLLLLEEVGCVACALKQGFFISWDETKTTCES